MIIAHNTSAINTYNKMGQISTETNKSMEKLSSGYKINRAADDAAGLSISEKMRSQIRGLNKAGENVEQGISMIQTAEGALAESHTILQRMRELAVQAANDTNAESDREALQSEINQLTSEINRIANTTEFNGMKMLDGSKVHITGKEDIIVANGGTINLGTNNGVQNRAHLVLKETIKFDKDVKPYGLDYTSIYPEEGVNYIDFGKKDGALVCNIHVVSADGKTSLDVKDYELKVDESGNYFYNDNGISFKLEKDSVTKFLRDANSDTVTHIDLFKTGKLEPTPAGAISGRNLKAVLRDWVNAVDNTTSSICFSFTPGDFVYIYKNRVSNSHIHSLDQLCEEMPDNIIMMEVKNDVSRDFHYHNYPRGTSTPQYLGIDISTQSLPDGIDVENFYESDSSQYGYISNLNVSDYDDANGKQQRLDFDKVEIEYANANKSFIQVHSYDGKSVFRKFEEQTLPLTIVNYEDYFDVDSSGNVSLKPGAELFIGPDRNNVSAFTDADIPNFVTGNPPDPAKLKVTFYNGADKIVEDIITSKGLGDIKSQETISYNANGVSFDIKLDELFDSNDKVHAIVDIDEKLNYYSHEGHGTEVDNSVYYHVGANTNQFINTEFSDMRANNLGLTGYGDNYTKNYTVTNGTDAKEIEKALNISNRPGANYAIEAIDKAIQMVSNERSKYGAIQNRLEYTLNNLNTTSENMSNAESTIRDVDMAEEMMDLTKSNIISQASQAMLVQATQRPQQVLQLLNQ